MSVSTVGQNTINSNSGINVRNIEYIDGFKLNALKIAAFDDLAKDPLVEYGSVLYAVESRIYSSQPESMLRSNIQKYMKEENLYLVEVNDTYKFRPDLISQIFYGTNEYYHYILLVNNMKSFLEFNPSSFNNVIFVMKPSIISLI